MTLWKPHQQQNPFPAPPRFGATGYGILLAALIGVLFWILHALVNTYTHDSSFWVNLFHPHAGDIGIRLLVQLGALLFTTLHWRIRRISFKLQEQETELLLARVVVDNSADPYLCIDINGRFTYANSAALESLGYSRDEILRLSIWDIDPTCSPDDWANWWLSLRLQKQQRFETAQRTKSGEMRTVEVTSNYIVHAGQELNCAFTRDITHRKREEKYAALKSEAATVLGKSLDQLTTLKSFPRITVPSLADACVTCLLADPDRSPVIEAATTEAGGGDLLREMISANLNEIQSGICDGTPLRLLRASRGMYRQISSKPEFLRFLHKLAPVSWVTVPMFARYRMIGFVCFVRVNGESYDKRDVAVLEELTRRLAAALDNALLYSASTRAIRTRDDFISIASHELKTPLTSLQLQVSLIRQLVQQLPDSGKLPRQIQKMSERCLRQVGNLGNLVNNLLDVTRINAGKIDLTLSKVDLTEQVRRVVEEMAPEIAISTSTTRVEALEHVFGHWDPSRIRQIITNLLSNAIKYGEGKPIRIQIDQLGSNARLIVEDQGRGIPNSQLSRIFERFERIDARSSIGGLGLGLYITRQIVQAHSGSIRVESEPGSGSRFVVELPMAMPPSLPISLPLSALLKPEENREVRREQIS